MRKIKHGEKSSYFWVLMNKIQEKRDKKLELLERKKTLESLIRNLIKSNLDNIKNVIYTYKDIKIDIQENCIKQIVLKRLDFWSSAVQKILSMKMENEFVKNSFKHSDDLYHPLTIYKIVSNRILSIQESTKDNALMECHINLLNGNIKSLQKETAEFIFPIDNKKYDYIDSHLKIPFIVKVQKGEYGLNYFLTKLDSVLNLFNNLEKLSEKELTCILKERHNKVIFIPAFFELEELDNFSTEILEEKIQNYAICLYRKQFTVKKKSVLINLLVLGIPYFIGKLDISYFETSKEYYNVHWIKNIK